MISKLEWAKLAESSRQREDVPDILKAQEEMLDTSYLDKWIAKLRLEDERKKARLSP